jgi:hypothetical protein
MDVDAAGTGTAPQKRTREDVSVTLYSRYRRTVLHDPP